MLKRQHFRNMVLRARDGQVSTYIRDCWQSILWSAPRSQGVRVAPISRAWVSVWLREQVKQKTADSKKSPAKGDPWIYDSQRTMLNIAIALLPHPTLKMKLKGTGRWACRVGLLWGEWREGEMGFRRACILYASGSAGIHFSFSGLPWVKWIWVELW